MAHDAAEADLELVFGLSEFEHEAVGEVLDALAVIDLSGMVSHERKLLFVSPAREGKPFTVSKVVRIPVCKGGRGGGRLISVNSLAKTNIKQNKMK